MSYRVFIAASAEKEMAALSEALHERITAKILSLSESPRPPGSQKLKGMEGYRIRVGDCRVVYTLDDTTGTVTIVAVGHRREVYR